MKFLYVDTLKDSKGLYLAVIGQPNGHLSNWRGCNYRKVILPGWPRGHRLEDNDFNRKILREQADAVDKVKLADAVRDLNGSHLRDEDCI